MSTSRIKPGGFVLIATVVIGLGLGLRWFFTSSSWALKNKHTEQSQLLGQIILPDAPKTTQGTNVAQLDLPTANASSVNAKPFTIEIMAWNAQMGLLFANGGPQTTQGSLMEKHRVKLILKRQDDCGQMAQNLVKFAEDYKKNGTPDGVNFCAIMGDGSAAFLAGIEPLLEKIGHEYRCSIIGTTGKSLGEDKLMGPQSWKDNPQSAKGATIAAVIRDGDWNIAVKWASDNGIAVNPDEKTYDPNAINFIAANDYIDAAQKYISGYTEDRDEVTTVNGKTARTGTKKKIEVAGVATWTPGDVTVAQEKGGLISIVSTAEYRSQMPCVIIGINKFMQDNRKEVESMLQAICEGGDQIKTFGSALNKGGEISAQIYHDKDAAYWVKYYRGVQETDKKGNVVSLGGSRAHNLADNLEFFGLNQGGSNIFASVYKVFGDIVSKLYPNLVPTYPAVSEILDLTYLGDIKNSEGTQSTTADKIVFNQDEGIQDKISKRSYAIEFVTGSAQLSLKAKLTLEDLYNQLVVASSLKVQIDGYTDNVGNESTNQTLSQARANAIRTWLENKSHSNFPDSRFGSVQGHGSSNPIADNTTEIGKAKNRRVEIVMGK